MRILLLTQWFDPEPTFKGLPFARALARLGHQVDVLTGFPNYPEGRIYDGYRTRLHRVDTVDGVTIHRIPLYPSHDRSAIKRSLNYLSFAATASIAALMIRKPDVAYVYHPPGSVGIPAAVLRIFRKIPFVLDVQDLWPDSVIATAMIKNRIALGLVDVLCRSTYKLAARIAVLSHGFKAALIERGVPETKIDVIPNWCDESVLLSSAGPASDTDPATFNVVYAGTMGYAQALEHVLTAAAELQDVAPHVRITFVGSGTNVPELIRLADAQGLKNVRFLPRQSLGQVRGLLLDADGLLVHLREDPLFRITIPSKTQAYMAIGKPLIMAVAGEAADVVKEAECGITCTPCDPGSIAAAIVALSGKSAAERATMGQNGARFYRERFAMDQGVRRFSETLAAARGGC